MLAARVFELRQILIVQAAGDVFPSDRHGVESAASLASEMDPEVMVVRSLKRIGSREA